MYPRPQEGDPCFRRSSSTTFIIIPRPAVTVPLRMYLSSLLRRSDTVVTVLLPPSFPYRDFRHPQLARSGSSHAHISSGWPGIIFKLPAPGNSTSLGLAHMYLCRVKPSIFRSTGCLLIRVPYKAPPSCTFDQEQVGRRFAAALLLPHCSGRIPGHTTRAPPVLCHCQLGQDILYISQKRINVCMMFTRTNRTLRTGFFRSLISLNLTKDKRNDLPTLGGHMLYIRTASSAWRS